MKVDRPEVALAPGESTAITISDSFGWALVSGASWESSDPGVVSVDSTGNITAHAAGTVTVTARVTAKQIYPWSTDVSEKTREFTTRVTVADHAITGVTAPDGVTVAAGTAADALGLPDSVAVTYDNGTSGTAPVVWADLTDEDKKALASRDGGSFTLHGTVDGWDSGTDITVTVTSAQVTVVWSNGDTTQETITWPELTDEQKAVVAARQGGSFTITGTVEGQDVTAKVTVSPALRLAVRAAQTGQPVGASLPITAKVTVTAASTPKPTDKPTTQSTTQPTDEPTDKPVVTPEPTDKPSPEPTSEPTQKPSDEPVVIPTDEPTSGPTGEPSTEPTTEPTGTPDGEETSAPASQPGAEQTPSASTSKTGSLLARTGASLIALPLAAGLVGAGVLLVRRRRA